MAKSESPLIQVEDTLELYLVKKAPFQLPTNIKEILVKFAPWVTLILVVLALPAIFAVVGLGAFAGVLTGIMGPFATAQYAQGITLSIIILIITVLLQILAIPGLFAKSIKGWRMLFYASIVGLVGSVLNPLSIVSALVGTIIGLYFLFQIRSYYK